MKRYSWSSFLFTLKNKHKSPFYGKRQKITIGCGGRKGGVGNMSAELQGMGGGGGDGGLFLSQTGPLESFLL